MAVEKYTIIDDQYVNEDRGDVLVILSDGTVYDQTTKNITNIDPEWMKSTPEYFTPYDGDESDDDAEPDINSPVKVESPALTGLEDLLEEDNKDDFPFVVIHDNKILIVGDDLEETKKEAESKSINGNLTLFKRISTLKTKIEQRWEE